MKKELKVHMFERKRRLLDFVNSNTGRLDIVSITSSQEFFFIRHYLWYYDK